MLKKIKTSIAQFIAAAHIVGPDLADGMETMRRAHSLGWRSTLCFWESAGQSPEEVTEQYIAQVRALGASGIDARISIKPAALRHNFRLLKSVIDEAKTFGIALQFDAEHPRFADEAFSLFELACCEYENIGYTLPARWDRSVVDAQRIVAMKKSVRLVKGQWNDPTNLHEHHIRSRFLNLADILKDGTNTVVIATHDKPLANAALTLLFEAGVSCELEQMFGLPPVTFSDSPARLAPKRMYVAYGTPYLPYNFSFIGERFAIMYWIMRDCLLRREKKLNLFGLSTGSYSSPFPLRNSQRIVEQQSTIAVEGK